MCVILKGCCTVVKVVLGRTLSQNESKMVSACYGWVSHKLEQGRTTTDGITILSNFFKHSATKRLTTELHGQTWRNPICYTFTVAEISLINK